MKRCLIYTFACHAILCAGQASADETDKASSPVPWKDSGVILDEFDGAKLSAEWRFESPRDKSGKTDPENRFSLTDHRDALTLHPKVGTQFTVTTTERQARKWAIPNCIRLARKIPRGNFRITTKVTGYSLKDQRTGCALYISQDDRNYFLVGKGQTHRGVLRIIPGAIVLGATDGYERYFPIQEKVGDDLWFRIIKTDWDGFTFQYSEDGERFVTVGRMPVAWASHFTAPTVGLLAANFRRPVPARFEFFKVEFGLKKPKTNNAIAADELFVDPPTIHNLGFRWKFTGDDNRNAKVTVRYRKHAANEPWRESMPLTLIRNDSMADQRYVHGLGWYRVFAHGQSFRLFAGSILDLQPATAYDVQLKMTDPDGGGKTEDLLVKTRTEPRSGLPGKRTVHVYPPDFAGKNESPNFADLQEAGRKAQAGDVVLLHPGRHKGAAIAVSGTEQEPIIFRGVSTADCQITPQIRLATGCHDVWFEKLTFVDNGVRADGSERIVIQKCVIVPKGKYGVAASGTGGGGVKPKGDNNWYIADNIITGPRERNAADMGGHGNGIRLAGSGNVICYNTISGFGGEAIVAGHVYPIHETWINQPDIPLVANDIYNNEIFGSPGWGTVSLRHSLCNVRVLRNRIRNCQVPFMTTRAPAGPYYIVRNVVAYSGSGPSTGYNNALLLYHNTMHMKSFQMSYASAADWRNNIFIGPADKSSFFWSIKELALPRDRRNRLDYNGYAIASSAAPRVRLQELTKDGTTSTLSFDEFRSATGNEEHSVMLDLNGAVRTPITFDYRVPAVGRQKAGVAKPMPFDARLRPDSRALDSGVLIRGVNDSHSGKSPDLGAIESGTSPPHYGPRP